jgi:hypothetical protein
MKECCTSSSTEAYMKECVVLVQAQRRIKDKSHVSSRASRATGSQHRMAGDESG